MRIYIAHCYVDIFNEEMCIGAFSSIEKANAAIKQCLIEGDIMKDTDNIEWYEEWYYIIPSDLDMNLYTMYCEMND